MIRHVHIGTRTAWIAGAATLVCALLIVLVLTLTHRGTSASGPRRYVDYLPASQSVSTNDDCSLPLAQRTGGWTC